jgi:hypothetical protein
MAHLTALFTAAAAAALLLLLQTLYNAMLENNCSEHASRMSAMENSSKSAGEILDKLTLQVCVTVCALGGVFPGDAWVESFVDTSF